MIALLAATVSSLGGAPEAAAATAGGGLELVGSPARSVRFVAGEGTVTVAVHNESARAGRLRFLFVRRGGDRVELPSGRPGTSAAIAVSDPAQLARPLRPGALGRVDLELRLAPGEAPIDGGGRLEVRLSTGGAPPVTVALRGMPPDLAFDPPRVTVDVSQACWLVGGTCGDKETVLVRGRDALAWARLARGPLGVAILNNPDGGSLSLRVRDPEVRDGAVRVTVDASDLSEAGRYSGRLPLDATGLGGPRLDVEVQVRWSLAAAVVVIFVGALFGGFFLRRFEIRRRRRLLELELRSALHRHDEERGRSGRRPASYDLDRLLEPRRHDQADTSPYPGTRGVSALLWHIRTARDDDDFSEDVGRTHALISEIERWLTLEPVARQTAELLDGDPPPSRGRSEFSDSQAYRDLARLRMRANVPPASDEACERLVGALAEQGCVVAKCKVIWELLGELESRNGWTVEQARTITDLDLLPLERRYPALGDRKPEQTDELRVALDAAERRLRRLQQTAGGPRAERERVAHALEIEARLEAAERNPAIDRELPDLSPWRLRLAGAFNQLALRSLLWTLARALVAAAAYALVIYSDTWGSVTDFASAFTAGFLTETVVNWAVLPAFRSHRNRGGAEPTPRAPTPWPGASKTAPPLDPLEFATGNGLPTVPSEPSLHAHESTEDAE